MRALPLVVLALAGSAQAQGRGGFVRVEGTRFTLDGQRFRFVGANASIMHGASHRAAAARTLDAIAADGLRVVRVWALGEHPDGAEPWTRDYAFRVGREGWVEQSFAHLDHVLAHARERDLRVVVVLANRWADYGGAPRYLEWAGIASPLRPDEALTRFFDEADARALYHAHVDRVVTRVNTVTGVPYREDPTILSWELINEGDIPPRSRDVLVRWTQETARFIRVRDPSHLIAAGHIGYTRQAQRDTWLAVQRLPEVDYADAHAYPTTLASFRAPRDLDDFVDDHAQLARHVLQKPFVWGEFGFSTNERVHRGHPRAQWYDRFLARSEIDDVDGALAWIYSTANDPPREHGIFVDAPRTRDVRRLLARYASRWRAEGSAQNPRLDPARGAEPLWATRRTVPGPGTVPALPRRDGAALRWSIPPERYATATSENIGRWDGFAVMHVYASGAARFTWRLRTTAPAQRAGRVRVRARVSSELPGRGEGATDIDRSRLRVSLDGVLLGEVTTPLDDGAGRWIEVESASPVALNALRRNGIHTLTLEVPEGDGANGLCVYGGATGREPVPEGTGALPGRVEVTLAP